MATLTTTPLLASDSPGMLPADRTLEPACGWFVLGTWLILTVVALGFVTLYGNRTPRWEDWFFVPFITGAQRVDLAWLWENVQGYRVPILKLVLCACYSLFGFNSKPILYLNVLLFSALSLGLLWAIRKARGRWSYTDAFFPIVLLNLGQAEAFSWAQTFAYVSTTSLETLLLILIVTHRGALNRTSLVLAGAILFLLPLTFGGGVVFAAMMVPWMLYQGWVVKGSIEPSSRHVRPIALGSAFVTVMIIGLYFVGYRPLNDAPGEQYVKPGLIVYAQTALKYLASGFGGAAYRPFWQFSSLLIAVILLATFLCLIQALARSRLTGDPRAVGLASYMVSCMAIAWVVGMGRYAWGNTIFDSRYAASSVVALLGSYFVWELHGPQSLVPLGRMLFFTAAAGFLAANFQLGYLHGQTLRDAERAFLPTCGRPSRSPGSLLIIHGSPTGTTEVWNDTFVNSVMPESPLTIICPLIHRSGCAHWAWSPPRSLRSIGMAMAVEFSGPMRISGSTWTSRGSSAACGFDSRWSIPAG